MTASAKPPAVKVTSKLNHAQYGIYFICLGAVCGSNGLISPISTQSLIVRDMVEEAFPSSPNRARKEELLFFASPFWRKLQNIFGGYCSSKMEEVAETHHGRARRAGHLRETPRP